MKIKKPKYFSSFSLLEKELAKQNYSKIFVLVDSNTRQHCFSKLLSFSKNIIIIEIKPTDEHKNLISCEKIWQTLSAENADRKSVLINIGGGMICDLGGFAASVYKRGIDFMHVPTTSMAMCDAAIGGKTAVNFANAKNIIGTFHQPKQIFICNDFLKSLPKRELISGLAEVMKHALLNNDKKILNQLNEIAVDDLDWKKLVKSSVEYKMKVIEKDFFEQNIRKLLNVGHTFGHAVEAALMHDEKKKLLHGEAVAMGFRFEILLAIIVFDLKLDEANFVLELLDKYFPIIKFSSTEKKKIIALLKADKKNQNGKINFSLFKKIGNAKIDCFVSEENIEQLLKAF